MLARAGELRASRVVLCSLPTMRAAHRLYLRHGFHRALDLDWEPVAGYPLLGFARAL